MKNSIRIIPLGGFDKIGMNMTIIEYNDSIIVVDCGTSFPPNNMPGIDTQIPDWSYLLINANKVKGIVLTHGHEDHIGAIPYFLSELNVPVYGTPLTIALVEKKLDDVGFKKYRTKVIKLGNTIVLGDFKVEFIRANHSIPDAAMLAIYTPEGIIFHTGDFKIDLSPITGDSIDLRRVSTLGAKGILALMSDSTNALQEGFSASESDVNTQLDILYNKYRSNRLIIATFASNMDRVQQIISLAQKYNRKVVLQGETMLSIFSAAERLNYLHIPDGILIEPDQIDKYNDDQLVFLMTGNHGEPISSLMEIATCKHPYLSIKPSDVILFSSIAIYGSEKDFSNTLNALEERGASIVFQDIHATGHACSEELRLLYTLLNPKYLIPSHGEYRYRRAAAKLGRSIGIPRENIFLIKNGDVLEMSAESCKVVDSIDLEEILIDGLVVGSIDHDLIQDRHILAKSGIVIAEICFDQKSGRLVSTPKILTKGFISESSETEIIEILQDTLSAELSRLITQNVRDKRLEAQIQKALEQCILDKTQQSPIVVVITTKVML